MLSRWQQWCTSVTLYGRARNPGGFPISDEGIYRLPRHPMRWGVLLEALGLALLAEAAWSYALVGLIALLIVLRNVDEDAMLREFQRHSRSSAD